MALRQLTGVLALISLRLCDRLHKCGQFLGIELTVMISICPRKLHFQETKNLIFRYGVRCCNRSDVVLDCHESLPAAKGPESPALPIMGISWTAIITPLPVEIL